jgi:hypothetical protein
MSVPGTFISQELFLYLQITFSLFLLFSQAFLFFSTYTISLHCLPKLHIRNVFETVFFRIVLKVGTYSWLQVIFKNVIEF